MPKVFYFEGLVKTVWYPHLMASIPSPLENCTLWDQLLHFLLQGVFAVASHHTNNHLKICVSIRHLMPRVDVGAQVVCARRISDKYSLN